MINFAHYFFKKRRLFILAEPRSGSSWLMETLDSHPKISLQGEILNQALNDAISRYVGGGEKEFRACLEYLEGLLDVPAKKTARFSGCKVLLNQLTLIGKSFPEFYLDFYHKAFFIFLYRANLVDGEISLQLAHQHGIWHVKQNEQVALKRIRLSPSVLVANLEKNLRRRNKLRQALDAGSRHCLSVSYEELFSQRENALAGIFAFLGLPGHPVALSNEMKGNPFQPEEVIENYPEVKAALEPYPHFLKMLLAKQFSEDLPVKLEP